MRVLALDAASEACSVALQNNGVVSARLTVVEREHGPRLLAMVDELLAEAGIGLDDLDALAFGCGPGSFTGLRIAAGITQGLALAADLPVIAVSDLAMLAQRAMNEDAADSVAVCCDARMGEAFVGFYRRDASGLARALCEDALVQPENLLLPVADRDWCTVGNGWRVFADLSERLGLSVSDRGAAYLPDARFALPLAFDMLRKDAVLPVEQALPVYLRESVAWRQRGS